MCKLVLKLKDIQKSYNAREVLSIGELNVYENDVIGIIGDNGSGKSTLLKIIMGEVRPDSGQIQSEIKFNYFSQVAEAHKSITLDLIDWELMRQFSLTSIDTATMSGGEEAKLRLIHTLSLYESGLICDEPTTHLDIDSKEVLRDILQYYYGTLIFVSHDRELLNNLATKIWVVDSGQVREYKGNYDAYKIQYERELLENESEVAKYQKEKERIELSVIKKKKQIESQTQSASKRRKSDRTPDRLSSSKQKDTVQKNLHKTVKAMESRLSQMKGKEKTNIKRRMNFPENHHLEMNNHYPIILDSYHYEIEGYVLFDKCNVQFERNTKIAICGENGIGKSSLFRSIVNKDAGVVISPKVVFSVYEQQDYRLVGATSMLQYLMMSTELSEPVVRRILHQLGFSQLDTGKSVEQLSGGEKTRLQLAKVFCVPSNVLMLDEPTNFIDLHTIEALEELIQSYPGTVLFTSHDKQFVENCADKVYFVQNKCLKEK